MRILFYLALLAMTPVLAGCKTTHACDGRGPTEYCELHHEMMEEETVTRTDQPMPSQEYLRARLQSFIHSYPFALPEGCKTCVVYICPDCVQAEREWLRRHPGGK